jgi:hypothetical protein
MSVRSDLIPFLVVLATASLFGQTVPSSSGPRVAVAARTDRPPRLDGTLNDPSWSSAPVIADYRQREPLETQPATEKTEVRILFDSKHIYFGIYCHDDRPKDIVSTQLRRDLSQDLDDNFAVLIDPTRSHLSAGNPVGSKLCPRLCGISR